MNNETKPTDLSGAPEEIKKQILENDQKLKGEEPPKRTRLVYICSRYKDNPEKNVQLAQEYCRAAMEQWPDVLPLAPHVYFTQFFDDSIENERAIGLAAGIALLDICDELWVYGLDNPSSGMAAEIKYAKEHGIPVFDAAKLYQEGRALDHSQLGNVIFEIPLSSSDFDGLSCETYNEVTVKGTLLSKLSKQLRRNLGHDLTVTCHE